MLLGFGGAKAGVAEWTYLSRRRRFFILFTRDFRRKLFHAQMSLQNENTENI
jgi:hypothetical protein